jgi:putative nucleotidyltransferase with HDIG domain
MVHTDLRLSSRLYIAIVVTFGTAIVLHSLRELLRAPLDPRWLMLALLTLLSGSFTVRIPGIPARLSVSETFVFAAALLFGAAAATMTVVLDTLVISFWLGRQASPPRSRVVFNVASAAIAIWVSTTSFYLLSGVQPLAETPVSVVTLLPWLVVLASLYFLLNSWLVAFVVGLHKQRSPLEVWRNNFLWLSLNYFSGASIAALVVPYLLQARDSSFVYIVLALLPVLIISYLTFNTALARIDDATTHLSELNRLYLSTIETLAMAIDAKDQITHGHIRRVQQYAVRLAKHMGIVDPDQISAIEAASLLHDMGKLAVPEYILNKPGKLTPAEFDRMKLHAGIGADILSAIDFPYPVVPIVRHHHESWDGTGYPDGLRATAIPIGARILAVVDCFDALTSDRPYRPRMSDNDAIAILLSRRGTMYDPLVVDAFIDVHSRGTDIALLDSSRSDWTGRLAVLPSTTQAPTVSHTRLDEIAASSEETLVLYDLALALSSPIDVSVAGDAVSRHLRRLVPASVVVLFSYDAHTDDLVSVYAAGGPMSHFLGFRIPRGERLSGWVAANRLTLLNSDPVLDFGDVVRHMTPRLKSSLSAPLMLDGELTGVLSVYAVEADAFTDEHKRIIEAISPQLASSLKGLPSLEQTPAIDVRDAASGQPNWTKLELAYEAVGPKRAETDRLSIIYLSARMPSDAHTASLPSSHDSQLLSHAIRRALRSADLLFQLGQGEFVALLSDTDSFTAEMVAARVRSAATTDTKLAALGLRLAIGVSTTAAKAVSVEEAVDVARGRQKAVPPPTAIH